MAERRRLPVLQSGPTPPPGDPPEAPEDPDAPPDRPPWHWVGFGTVALFATWLPLAYVAQSLGNRLVASRFPGLAPEAIAAQVGALPTDEYWRMIAVVVGLHLLALALGGLAGGYLVGRFGKGTTLREPTAAGGIAAFVALVISVRWGGGIGSAILQALPILLVAVATSALGGRLGLRRRGA